MDQQILKNVFNSCSIWSIAQNKKEDRKGKYSVLMACSPCGKGVNYIDLFLNITLTI